MKLLPNVNQYYTMIQLGLLHLGALIFLVCSAVLQAQLSEHDRTIEQLQTHIVELEQELTALRIEKTRWVVERRERQI
jgi:hypothetical protein